MATRVPAPPNREDTIKAQMKAAITALKTEHDEAQTIIDNNFNNINQVNQALDIMADHIQTLQRMVGKLIRLEVRQLDGTEL